MGAARDALDRRVERFADEIEALVRRATLAAVQDALSGEESEQHGSSGSDEFRRVATSAERPIRKPRRRQKLSPARAKLLEEMAQYVSAHPGAHMKEISAALRFRTDFLQPLMKRLLDSGALRKEGQRNATRYFPVESCRERRAPRSR